MPRDPTFDDLTATEATIAGKTADNSDPYALVSETGAAGSTLSGGLASGNIVGVGQDGLYVKDPANFGGDTATVQAAADDVGNSGGGYVYIPAEKPDGTAWTLGTVNMGDHTGNGPVVPNGWNFSRDGNYIETSITDGSPVFDMNGSQLDGMTFGGLFLGGNGVDAEAMRFREGFTGAHVQNITVRGFGAASPAADGAFVWESGCNNSTHTNLRYNQRGPGGENPDVSGMNVLAFRETSAGVSPSEHMFRGCNSYADPANPFNNWVDIGTSGASELAFVNCRFEGSGGDGHIAGSTGSVGVVNCELARTETNANAVDFTGFKFMYMGNHPADTQDGDHIRIDPTRVVIGAFKCNANGDDIFVTGSPGGGNVPQVPNQDVLRGTVGHPNDGGASEYPSGLEENATTTT